MRCSHPIEVRGGKFPCGRCLPCRITIASQWSMRMVHEAETVKESCFLTLTYDEEHLPPNLSLSKREAQLFLKRFRKVLGGRKFRYMLCGEYGDESLRPHYHLCIFGWKPSDSDLFRIRNYGKPVYMSRTVLKAWPYGRNSADLLNHSTARYCVKYTIKSLTGSMAKAFYGDRVLPFRLMSKGLGKDWLLAHSSEILSKGGLFRQGKPVGVPRYYRKVLNLDVPQAVIEKSVDEREKLFSENAVPGKDYAVFHQERNEQRERNVQAREDLFH